MVDVGADEPKNEGSEGYEQGTSPENTSGVSGLGISDENARLFLLFPDRDDPSRLVSDIPQEPFDLSQLSAPDREQLITTLRSFISSSGSTDARGNDPALPISNIGPQNQLLRLRLNTGADGSLTSTERDDINKKTSTLFADRFVELLRSTSDTSLNRPVDAKDGAADTSPRFTKITGGVPFSKPSEPARSFTPEQLQEYFVQVQSNVFPPKENAASDGTVFVGTSESAADRNREDPIPPDLFNLLVSSIDNGDTSTESIIERVKNPLQRDTLLFQISEKKRIERERAELDAFRDAATGVFERNDPGPRVGLSAEDNAQISRFRQETLGIGVQRLQERAYVRGLQAIFEKNATPKFEDVSGSVYNADLKRLSRSRERLVNRRDAKERALDTLTDIIDGVEVDLSTVQLDKSSMRELARIQKDIESVPEEYKQSFTDVLYKEYKTGFSGVRAYARELRQNASSKERRALANLSERIIEIYSKYEAEVQVLFGLASNDDGRIQNGIFSLASQSKTLDLAQRYKKERAFWDFEISRAFVYELLSSEDPSFKSIQYRLSLLDSSSLAEERASQIAQLRELVTERRRAGFRRTIREKYLSSPSSVQEIREAIRDRLDLFSEDESDLQQLQSEALSFSRRVRNVIIENRFSKERAPDVLTRILEMPTDTSEDIREQRRIFALYQQYVSTRSGINPDDAQYIADIPLGGILPQPVVDVSKSGFDAPDPQSIPAAPEDALAEYLDRIDGDQLTEDIITVLPLNIEETTLLREEANKRKAWKTDEESLTALKRELQRTLLDSSTASVLDTALSIEDQGIIRRIRIDRSADQTEARMLRAYADAYRRILQNDSSATFSDVGNAMRRELELIVSRRRTLSDLSQTATLERTLFREILRNATEPIPSLDTLPSDTRQRLEQLKNDIASTTASFRNALRVDIDQAQLYIDRSPERTDIDIQKKKRESDILTRIRKEQNRTGLQQQFFEAVGEGNLTRAKTTLDAFAQAVGIGEAVSALQREYSYWLLQERKLSVYEGVNERIPIQELTTRIKSVGSLCKTAEQFEEFSLLADRVRGVYISRFSDRVRSAYLNPALNRAEVIAILDTYPSTSPSESAALDALRAEVKTYFRRQKLQNLRMQFTSVPAQIVLKEIADEPSDSPEAELWKEQALKEYMSFLSVRSVNRATDLEIVSRANPDLIVARRSAIETMQDLGENKGAFFRSLKLFRRSLWPIIQTFRSNDVLRKRMERYVRIGKGTGDSRPGPELGQFDRFMFTVRERALSRQRPLTNSERRYIRSVEWLSSTTPHMVALANADRATLSEYMQGYFAQLSEKTREKLVDEAYFPAIVIGAGPSGIAAMGQLLRQMPDAAAQTLVVDNGDDPGGVFAFHGPGWQLNSANPVQSSEGIILPDPPNGSVTGTVRAYATAGVGRWYPGERREGESVRRTSINAGIPWSVDVSHISPARYATNEELQVALAMNAAVTMQQVAFRTQVVDVRPALDGKKGNKVVTLDLYDGESLVPIRRVRVRTDVVITSTGLGEESYGFGLEGSRAKSVIDQGKNQRGFKKVSRFLEAMGALADRGSEDVPDIGKTIAIVGSGNGKDTLVERILGLFPSGKMSTRQVEKVYVIASNRGTDRLRYAQILDLERRAFGREGIIEFVEAKVGDVDFTEGTRTLPYELRKLELYRKDGSRITSKGQRVEVDTVITSAGFTSRIPGVFGAYVGGRDLESSQNIEGIALPGNPDISVGARVKSDPGVVFVGVASPAAFNDPKLRQLPPKSRAVLDAVGKENAVALGFRLPDVEATVNLLCQSGIIPDIGESPSEQEREVMISRGENTLNGRSDYIFSSIDDSDLHIPDNIQDAKPLLSALAAMRLQRLHFVNGRKIPFTGTFSFRITRDDDGDFIFKLQGTNARPVSEEFLGEVVYALSTNQLQRFTAYELSKLRDEGRYLTLNLAIERGRVNAADTYIQ